MGEQTGNKVKGLKTNNGLEVCDPKECNFLISRDFIFYVATILNPIPHKDHDVANNKVDIKVETPKQIENTHEDVTLIENNYYV